MLQPHPEIQLPDKHVVALTDLRSIRGHDTPAEARQGLGRVAVPVSANTPSPRSRLPNGRMPALGIANHLAIVDTFTNTILLFQASK